MLEKAINKQSWYLLDDAMLFQSLNEVEKMPNLGDLIGNRRIKRVDNIVDEIRRRGISGALWLNV